MRLRNGAHLGRTPAVAGNRKTWTWSGWVKRGALNNTPLFSVHNNSNPDYLLFFFTPTNILQLNAVQNTSTQRLIAATSSVFRDPSAHYHIVLSVDTTQASNANGVRIWVNGVQQQLTFSVYTQNYDTAVNSTLAHFLGRWDGVADFGGYLSEVHFIDGQALTASDFGIVDAFGVWQPKAYGGTYGAQGWYLKFNDATNLTALAQDGSGNGNHWTATGVSLAAGATYDWMADAPGNNFAVLNPLARSQFATMSGGNLNVSWTDDASAQQAANPASIALPPFGKWYWEVSNLSIDGNNGFGVGICPVGQVANLANNWPTDYNIYRTDANGTYRGYSNGVTGISGLAPFSGSQVCGVAVDLDNGRFWAAVDGAWQGGGDPAAGTLPGLSGISNAITWVPFVFGWEWTGLVASASINFGQRPFAYSPPSGFNTLCAANLPAPAIRNPRQHFDVRTRVGTGAPENVTGYPFAPDLVWIKSRGRAIDHALYDRLRGAQIRLEPNRTDAEVSADGGLTALNSDGYALNALDEVNGTAAVNSFVDWVWRAGGAGSSNTDGSIASAVSANVTAGVSIATYTGTGANGTVGHGLGVAPRMVIAKRRNNASAWATQHADIVAANSLYLNTAAASAAAATAWNSAKPNSTVFSIGASTDTNANGAPYVAYCFAEVPAFSRISSYVGNGNVDGSFVWCGFRPAFVMIKRTDSVADWMIIDAKRRGFNEENESLSPNLINDENVTNSMDFTASGFKLRTTDFRFNAAAGAYIFLAFAEAPFKFARAR
ncbi:MAG: hypothetical protein IOB09_30730 [Burkholderia sp.]|nr:hypothetical protein [Burkholderia sp.]